MKWLQLKKDDLRDYFECNLNKNSIVFCFISIFIPKGFGKMGE